MDLFLKLLGHICALGNNYAGKPKSELNIYLEQSKGNWKTKGLTRIHQIDSLPENGILGFMSRSPVLAASTDLNIARKNEC